MSRNWHTLWYLGGWDHLLYRGHSLVSHYWKRSGYPYFRFCTKACQCTYLLHEHYFDWIMLKELYILLTIAEILCCPWAAAPIWRTIALHTSQPFFNNLQDLFRQNKDMRSLLNNRGWQGPTPHVPALNRVVLNTIFNFREIRRHSLSRFCFWCNPPYPKVSPARLKFF